MLHLFCSFILFEFEVNLLFNVTINDISVIYATAHRCAGGLKKKLDLRSGSQRHRHFVRSLTCPSSHRHGTTLFIRWFRDTAPFSRLLRSRWGYGGHILDLTPRALTGGWLVVPRHSRRHFSHICTTTKRWSLSLLVFYVTCNDIFSHICDGTDVYLRSGIQRHRHFAGSL